MTKTLADMTAEERRECVGMWCECVTGHDSRMAVLLNDSGLIIFPDLLKSGTLEIGLITPRVDLPRAWTSDGAPELAQALAEEEYQYGVTYIGLRHGGHHIEWVENTGNAELDRESLQLLVKHWKNAGQSPKTVRRRVSQPEVVE